MLYLKQGIKSFVFGEISGMKKALTILTVMILITSAVFASTETAPAGSVGIIKIRSHVDREDPSFEIRAAFGNQNATAGVEAPESVLSVSDISDGDVTVAFGIYQTHRANNRFKYHFTVAFGQFTNGTYIVDEDITIKNLAGDWYTAGEATGVKSVDTLHVNPANETEIIGLVEFSGIQAVDASTTAKRTFEVTWTGDREAPAGDYEADVTMTIEVD